ncbi:hypothetical protein D3C71_1653470 [compost metagenome]
MTVKTAKFSLVGSGAYWIRAPPTKAAPAIPIACAAAVTPAACLIFSGALNSRTAAADGPADNPTPMPMKARPTKIHATSGATANNSDPVIEASSPSSIVSRRPI